MIRPLQAAAFAVSAAGLALFCGFISPSSHLFVSSLIATEAPVYQPLAALRSGERFPKVRNCYWYAMGGPRR